MPSDELRLQLVMKLPGVLDDLIREPNVGLTVPRSRPMRPGPIQ